MLSELSEGPLAVLLPLDGGLPVVFPLMQLPPPTELLMPVKARFAVRVDDEPRFPSPHRVFRLEPWLRARSHRWWHVYNEGRSRTPEDGFVYREVRH